MKIAGYLSRRSFFGAAGAAAAAGSLAVEAVAKDIGGRALSHSATSFGSASSNGNSASRYGTAYLDNLRTALSRLKVEPVKASEVGRLDPDLLASRSLAFHARLRIQAERDTISRYESRKALLLRQIAEEGGVI